MGSSIKMFYNYCQKIVNANMFDSQKWCNEIFRMQTVNFSIDAHAFCDLKK